MKRAILTFLAISLSQLFLGQSSAFELLILGTAQDAGYPQIGCQKQCCSAVSKKESVASIAIHSKDQFWLVDATPDFTEQFNTAQLAFGSASFEGIFLTHAHIGHYTGLMYLGKEAMDADSVPVYCLPKMAAFISSNQPWKQLVNNGNIKLITLRANVSNKINSNVSVTALPVPHRDEFSETCGYLVATQSKKVLYIPDIDKWDEWKMSITEWIRLVDIALLDATFYDGNELPERDMSEIPHPFVVESMAMFEGISPTDRGKIYFTHFNHTNPLLKEVEQTRTVEEAGYNIARTGVKL